MAYALKVDEFPAAQLKPDQPELPSYPPGSSEFPPPCAPPRRPTAARAAQHLKEAIRHYEAALALAPDNLTARLGHGWVLAAGRRHAGEPSPNTDGHQAGLAERAAGQGPHAVAASVHAARRRAISSRCSTRSGTRPRLPTCAPSRRRSTRCRGRSRRWPFHYATICAASAIVDPLARVRFDADGSGPREWTWITPDAGWLVYDADGDAAESRPRCSCLAT